MYLNSWTFGMVKIALVVLQVIKVNNLHLANKLHVSEQTWTKTAEHFTVFLMSKVNPDASVNLYNLQSSTFSCL